MSNEMRKTRAEVTLWLKKAKPADMVRCWSTTRANCHSGFRKQDVEPFHAHPCNQLFSGVSDRFKREHMGNVSQL